MNPFDNNNSNLLGVANNNNNTMLSNNNSFFSSGGDPLSSGAFRSSGPNSSTSFQRTSDPDFRRAFQQQQQMQQHQQMQQQQQQTQQFQVSFSPETDLHITPQITPSSRPAGREQALLPNAPPPGGTISSLPHNPPRYKFKTELCRNWEATGTCNYRQCTFAHGAEELRHYMSKNGLPMDGNGAESPPQNGQQQGQQQAQPLLFLPQQQQFPSFLQGRSGNSPPANVQILLPNGTTASAAAAMNSIGNNTHGNSPANCNHNNNGNANNGGSPALSPSVQVVHNVDRLLSDFISEVLREKEAFTQLADRNRSMERELQNLQVEHAREKQTLTSLRERAAGLRSQLETVPLPSFMGKQQKEQQQQN